MCKRCLMTVNGVAAVAVLGLWVTNATAEADRETTRLEKQRCPKPTEFANVFSFGYAQDKTPKDDARFQELLKKIKEAGFNTIHCAYTGKRLELCKKHGVKMMIDLLAAGHHIYRNVEGAKALCKKLRENPAVWGYNIWNDNIGRMSAGRKRDINNVRAWDPTHPAFCGTYRTYGMRHLTNADIFGYYNYHWKRGPHYHFPHLLRYWNWATERNAYFYRWVYAESGIPGKGNYNRSLYTLNTSLACGLKGVLWFIGGKMMSANTLEWTTTGGDIIKVNKEIMPLSKEIMRIGNPVAVYSTPITKTLKDRALPEGESSMMPPGLERHPFPKGSWIRPTRGELVMGAFKDERNRRAIFVANHNAYAEQTVMLKFSRPVRARIFNRKEGKWQSVAVANNTVTFKLDAAGGELLRLEK